MSNSRARRFRGTWMLTILLVAGGAFGDSDPGLPEELIGDWYVLVHYRDSDAEDPEQRFWDDEIWRIAARGDRLSWTSFPHVTLRDDAGRFEALPSGGAVRTAVAWSPSASQLDEIRGALELDDYESRAKTLRGSSREGWRSGRAPNTGSASMISYQESWSIVGPPGARELARQVVFEAARADRVEGRTVYTVRESRPGGDELWGAYSRDGRFVGEFRMLRIRLPRGSSR